MRDNLVLVVEELNGFSKFLLENAHPTCMNDGWCDHIIRRHWWEPELESFFIRFIGCRLAFLPTWGSDDGVVIVGNLGPRAAGGGGGLETHGRCRPSSSVGAGT